MFRSFGVMEYQIVQTVKNALVMMLVFSFSALFSTCVHSTYLHHNTSMYGHRIYLCVTCNNVYIRQHNPSDIVSPRKNEYVSENRLLPKTVVPTGTWHPHI